jgi:hypothetical protein
VERIRDTKANQNRRESATVIAVIGAAGTIGRNVLAFLEARPGIRAPESAIAEPEAFLAKLATGVRWS